MKKEILDKYNEWLNEGFLTSEDKEILLDMSDEEVCEKCHWWCEENNLVDDYRKFEDKFFNR